MPTADCPRCGFPESEHAASGVCGCLHSEPLHRGHVDSCIYCDCTEFHARPHTAAELATGLGCPGPAVHWRARCLAYEAALAQAIKDEADAVAHLDPAAPEPSEAQMTLARLQGVFDSIRRAP